MLKNIISIVLILAVVGLTLLFYRSCTDNREYRERIEQLGSEIDEYTEINERLSEQNREFEASIGRLEQQLNVYRKRIEEAKRIVAELSDDTSAIRGELSAAIEQVRRIKEIVRLLKAELDVEGPRADRSGDPDNNIVGDIDGKME